MTPIRLWYNLAPFWEALAAKARERDEQKANYASTCNWSQHSTHFLGLLGEKVIELATGLKIDLVLRACGDGGRDFIYLGKKYEIRATQYFEEPHLKQKPNATKWADYYILIGVDVANKRAYIVGWATQTAVRNAVFRNYGYGNMLTLLPQELAPGLPDALPRVDHNLSFDNMFDNPVCEEPQDGD